MLNFSNIQTDTTVRIAAIVCLILGFIACLIVMVYQYATQGNVNLPPLVTTVITSVLTFSVTALSSHQGAQIQQNGSTTGAATVADTTLKAASALEKVNSGPIASQTNAVLENTKATEANTAATNEASHG